MSAGSLKMAGGQVRCGRCGELFNALERLSDDVTGYSYTDGESPLDLESRADEILRSAQPAAAVPMPPPSSGTDVAQLEFLGPLDDELPPDATLELTLPPEELDRIFVETTPNLGELLFADAPPMPPPPTAAPAGFEVPDEVRRAMLGNFGPKLAQIDVPRRRLPRSAWAAAAVLLALLLAAQLMMANNAWLSAHVPLIESESDQEPQLSAYKLGQWGVAADPAARGTLRVRASILNVAAQMQPYPLLRVRLTDRFGTRVAERVFEPSEYLGKLSARMLGPGERIDAIMDIVDPGKEAEGFEIDVCLRGALNKISCAADAAAAAAAP